MSDEAPPRLDADADVPEMAARALRAARADVPDEDHLRRVEGLLMARLALGAAGGGGSQGSSGAGNPGPSGPPPATGGAAGSGASTMSVVVGGGLSIVALVCGGLIASRLSEADPAEAHRPSTPVAAPSAPNIVVTPPSAFVAPPATVASPAGTQGTEKTVSIDDLPRAPQPQVPPPAKVAGDAQEEVTLLSDAQKTLRSDPSATLRICSEHAKRFPGGALAQERDSLAIEALVSLGRKPEARARLDRFRAAYPTSGHLRKLDALF